MPIVLRVSCWKTAPAEESRILRCNFKVTPLLPLKKKNEPCFFFWLSPLPFISLELFRKLRLAPFFVFLKRIFGELGLALIEEGLL